MMRRKRKRSQLTEQIEKVMSRLLDFRDNITSGRVGWSFVCFEKKQEENV